jgi:hypothetical protein
VKFKVNIYCNDTEWIIASVYLNQVVSNRVRKIIKDWNNIGEYDLDTLIWDHKLTLNFIDLDTSRYSFMLEQVND